MPQEGCPDALEEPLGRRLQGKQHAKRRKKGLVWQEDFAPPAFDGFWNESQDDESLCQEVNGLVDHIRGLLRSTVQGCKGLQVRVQCRPRGAAYGLVRASGH
jgi:hypothetical protein